MLQKSLFSSKFLWDSSLSSVSKESGQFRQQNPPWCLDVIPCNKTDTFLRQDDDMLLHLESSKEKLAFDNLSYVLKSKQNIFFIFLVYKTLRAIVTLFFSNIFQSYYCNGNFVPSQLYLFIENLIFVILSKVFLFVHDLIWKY